MGFGARRMIPQQTAAIEAATIIVDVRQHMLGQPLERCNCLIPGSRGRPGFPGWNGRPRTLFSGSRISVLREEAISYALWA
jgi:hypothetical protein